MSTIDGPVLVITGDHDLASRTRAAETLAEQSNQTPRRAVIQAAGHLPNLDNPKDYNAVVRAFPRTSYGPTSLARSATAALHELAHENELRANNRPNMAHNRTYLAHKNSASRNFRPPSGTSRGTKSAPQCSVNPEFGIVSGLWRRTIERRSAAVRDLPNIPEMPARTACKSCAQAISGDYLPG